MTLDRLPDGRQVPGGPSLFAARMGASLGAQVTLVTALPERYPSDAFTGLRTVIHAPAPAAPEYENVYGPGDVRTQFLHHPGAPLPADMLAALPPADAAFVAPAFHELDGAPLPQHDITGVCLQGVLRARAAESRVRPVDDVLAAAGPYLRRGAFVFLSEEDTPAVGAIGRAGAAAGATVFVTRGARGVTVFGPAGACDVPAIAAASVDPTGAGDCFAAAFTVRYAETRDFAEALRWALAAGALATEGHGPAGVPGRSQVEARAREATVSCAATVTPSPSMAGGARSAHAQPAVASAKAGQRAIASSADQAKKEAT